jgi:hypothetical protein
MTASEAKQVLLAAGVPADVVDVWGDVQSRAVGRQHPLGIAFGPPDYDKADELRSAIPELGELVPIFEQNGEAVIGYLPGPGHFVRFYYEDGLDGADTIEVIGKGYQQFAATILLEYEEAGLKEYYAPLAELLEFHSAPVLRKLLDAEPYDDEAVERFHELLAEDGAQ